VHSSCLWNRNSSRGNNVSSSVNGIFYFPNHPSSIPCTRHSKNVNHISHITPQTLTGKGFRRSVVWDQNDVKVKLFLSLRETKISIGGLICENMLSLSPTRGHSAISLFTEFPFGGYASAPFAFLGTETPVFLEQLFVHCTHFRVGICLYQVSCERCSAFSSRSLRRLPQWDPCRDPSRVMGCTPLRLPCLHRRRQRRRCFECL